MKFLTKEAIKAHGIDEFNIVEKFYSDKVAKRSKVPLINHIIEGCVVLISLGARRDTIAAYCLHPIFQNDEDLKENFDKHAISSKVMCLVMEYRNIANAFLSTRTIIFNHEISLSPLNEVNQMLIADKIQNYKDFLLYHKETHARAHDLDIYFKDWFTRLEVENYMGMINELTELYPKIK